MEAPQGMATPEGTHALAGRFQRLGFALDAFSDLQGLSVASIGMGTYLGDNDETYSRQVQETLRLGLRGGINLVDTAINYRDQLSERVVGRALKDLQDRHEFTRSEIVVCTKGGYVPLDADDPMPARQYIQREYLGKGLIAPAELVAGCHCLSPAFLEDQLRRSLKNLGLAAVDVYYLHNPEAQLAEVSRYVFAQRLRQAFEWLEKKVHEGKMLFYGVATWNGLRLKEDDKEYLSLEEMENLARETGGAGHHFRVVQAPFNLRMPEAFNLRNQRVSGKAGFTLADACRQHGISLVTSAPLLQGQLSRELPQAAREAFPGLREDAQKVLQFARSCPGSSCALAGMSRKEHVASNLALLKMEKAGAGELEEMISKLPS
jgi:aryl-alcohol dehydrogenase-like predicted oxidoreductase